MKNCGLIFLIILPVCILLLTSCKVKSQKTVAENDPQESKSISVVDLANLNTEGLNPDEAIVNVLVTRIENGKSITVIFAEVITIEKRGFGFHSNLNSKDRIIINVNNDISLDNIKEFKCVIEKIITRNEIIPKYRLVRLL